MVKRLIQLEAEPDSQLHLPLAVERRLIGAGRKERRIWCKRLRPAHGNHSILVRVYAKYQRMVEQVEGLGDEVNSVPLFDSKLLGQPQVDVFKGRHLESVSRFKRHSERPAASVNAKGCAAGKAAINCFGSAKPILNGNNWGYLPPAQDRLCESAGAFPEKRHLPDGAGHKAARHVEVGPAALTLQIILVKRRWETG